MKSKLQGWLNQADGTLKEYLELSKKSFDEAFSDLKQKGGKTLGISLEKLAELKEKFYELKKQAQQALEEQRKIWAARFEELKQKIKEAGGIGKEKLQELKKKAKEALQEEQAKWEARLNEWRQKVKEAFEAIKDKWNNKKE